jgi:predicted metalloendopeptidase
MTLAELSKLTPSINWNTYFTKIGLAKVDTVIVSQPKYMVALETMLKENKVDQWKAYMRWSLLNRASSQLSTDIENANFEFYGKP